MQIMQKIAEDITGSKGVAVPTVNSDGYNGMAFELSYNDSIFGGISYDEHGCYAAAPQPIGGAYSVLFKYGFEQTDGASGEHSATNIYQDKHGSVDVSDFGQPKIHLYN